MKEQMNKDAKQYYDEITGTFFAHNLLFNTSDCGAQFSHDRAYRYSLWRIWDRTKPCVMFIGLNPSTANEMDSDPTIRSCGRIAKAKGFGGFYVANCWAFISTDPKLLQTSPMSDDLNDTILKAIACKCKEVVFAWGSFSIVSDLGRDKQLMEMFPKAKALHINKNGSPKHPLYCSSNIKFIEFNNYKHGT